MAASEHFQKLFLNKLLGKKNHKRGNHECCITTFIENPYIPHLGWKKNFFKNPTLKSKGYAIKNGINMYHFDESAWSPGEHNLDETLNDH